VRCGHRCFTLREARLIDHTVYDTTAILKLIETR